MKKYYDAHIIVEKEDRQTGRYETIFNEDCDGVVLSTDRSCLYTQVRTSADEYIAGKFVPLPRSYIYHINITFKP